MVFIQESFLLFDCAMEKKVTQWRKK